MLFTSISETYKSSTIFWCKVHTVPSDFVIGARSSNVGEIGAGKFSDISFVTSASNLLSGQNTFFLHPLSLREIWNKKENERSEKYDNRKLDDKDNETTTIVIVLCYKKSSNKEGSLHG